MKITVDLNKCQGYASCVIAAPEYFDLNDGGQVHILQATFGADDNATVRDAVNACPVAALTLVAS